MPLILESSKRNEDSHMTVTIKVNYQTTFQKKEATK
ncbi:alanine racemase [Streptococcus mitis]|uniref:Alanine racemase n=2 Tax=Streptococcus mitis TaxID=28037 RepID=A0A2I1YYP6_STRMT|nr:alanine racemase [Streptococcus mitis]MQQ40793.1 alanine racemase [Streptococcus mitis]MQQ61835.1 alanine racemase [Streptococcus mitis]PLA60017.1 alanine racemase [Streptococcus mitis]